MRKRLVGTLKAAHERLEVAWASLRGRGEDLVAEVFSPPRVAAAARERGLRSGESFDIETGFDLSRAADQDLVMSYLESKRPGLVVVCPPCGPFTTLQHLGLGRSHGTLAHDSQHQARLAHARVLLRFAMKVCTFCPPGPHPIFPARGV